MLLANNLEGNVLFKVDPINGRSIWVKAPCLTTLLPPKHCVMIGRLKKKRKKSA